MTQQQLEKYLWGAATLKTKKDTLADLKPALPASQKAEEKFKTKL